MRRLLPAVIAAGLVLALAVPAFAADRVPSGVKRVSVTLTFPPQTSGSRKPVRRTFTTTAKVHNIVNAANSLQIAKVRGLCPMFVRLGPELTVVFRGGSGSSSLAEVKVEVALGSKGSSGSSACFPIHFTTSGSQQALVGNSFVRLVGRMIGTAIS